VARGGHDGGHFAGERKVERRPHRRILLRCKGLSGDTENAKSPRPAFASGDDDQPTFAELKAAYYGYIALFGTYTVDEAKHVVVQHIEGTLRLPQMIGADMERPFELSGDRLIIGDQKTLRIVSERVK
jgi:hypothetical protein